MANDIITKSPKDYYLTNHTTLKIGGKAEYAYFPSNIEELCDVKNYLKSINKEMHILGYGSNVLISSKGVDGGVIFTNNLNEFEFLEDKKVKCYSGVKSATLARALAKESLAGLEFLIGIPGTIGGAVTMNSSAHGHAIKDTIESVEFFDFETSNIIELNKSELNLAYRSSFVETGKHFVISATFKLEGGNADELLKNMEFFIEYRKKHHPPLTEPNAGSTFRNPAEGVYVGKLLDELGAKGWKEGGATISDKHANFIINSCNATSTDVLKLMHKMQSLVKAKYSYKLKPEIKCIGYLTKEEEEIWQELTSN